MTPAAFFDIDHTLIAGDSGVLYMRYLLRRGLVRRRDLVAPLYYTILHRLNRLDIDALFARYTAWVRGVTHSELVSLCADWYAAMVRPLIYPRMIELLREHQRAGHVVAILSSATNYVAEPLGHELAIDHLLVNRLEVTDGRLTGDAQRPLCYGAGKLYWARRFVADHDVDLRASYFYSDSITDLPVLELVGRPHAVNPDRLLRRVARARDWPIVKCERDTPGRRHA